MPGSKTAGLFTVLAVHLCASIWLISSTNWSTCQRSTWWTAFSKTSPSSRCVDDIIVISLILIISFICLNWYLKPFKIHKSSYGFYLYIYFFIFLNQIAHTSNTPTNLINFRLMFSSFHNSYNSLQLEYKEYSIRINNFRVL